jgi:hypothetical protein
LINKLFSELRYTISYQNSLEVREKQKTGSVEFVEEEDEVSTLGFNLDVVSNFNEHWNATTGAEYYHDHVASTANMSDLEYETVTALEGFILMDRFMIICGFYPASV